MTGKPECYLGPPAESEIVQRLWFSVQADPTRSHAVQNHSIRIIDTYSYSYQRIMGGQDVIIFVCDQRNCSQFTPGLDEQRLPTAMAPLNRPKYDGRKTQN